MFRMLLHQHRINLYTSRFLEILTNDQQKMVIIYSRKLVDNPNPK